MRLLSSFKHLYYSFDIPVRVFIAFLSVFFFRICTYLQRSVKILQICTYLQRSAKILQICTDSQRSKTRVHWKAAGISILHRSPNPRWHRNRHKTNTADDCLKTFSSFSVNSVQSECSFPILCLIYCLLPDSNFQTSEACVTATANTNNFRQVFQQNSKFSFKSDAALKHARGQRPAKKTTSERARDARQSEKSETSSKYRCF